ncbi:MAG: copper-translocating P-type ATPase [Ignavibacteriae bacterium]|nr:copper-translocating P-type ATPase [Ignavibacteriota bacterium]
MDHHHHHSHGGNGAPDHSAMIGDYRKRFTVSLILTLPVLVLSPMIQELLGFKLEFTGHLYVLFALSSVIFFYGGWPFLKGLIDELRTTGVGMMTLIALAISVAYFYSTAVIFGLTGKIFYWELATLIDIMLLGHLLEMKSIMGASRSLELLVQLMPSEAHLIENGSERDVKLSDIKVGDLIRIKPGEKIPADGTVVDGETYVNESMLTGESKPVQKKKDDKVIGGSINGNGSITVKVEHTGEESYLSKVITLVQDAQKAKSKTQKLADKAAAWLTYVALGAGIITIIAWLVAGYSFEFSLERMVTVMVISCPHALGLAIPLVVAISTAVSAKNGLLIRNRTAFENTRKITAIIFDKTGTLTEGKFGVSKYDSLNDKYSKEDILRYAASLESNSEHPIAEGIVEKAKELKLDLHPAQNFNAMTGEGIEADVDGKQIKVVSPAYVKKQGHDISKEIDSESAGTTVYVLIDNTLSGIITLADEIRKDSKEAVDLLKKSGIKVYMATGDNEKVASYVARELGLDGYYAEVLPDGKQKIIRDMQSKGEFVAMTGDGINDAPALAAADVGIAVGSGTDVAAETADIILVNSNPRDITSLILFGKATYNKMVQNLLWATGYNAIALPLAAGVLYSQGIVISPAIGAVLMSVSTIVVALNAQLLKRKLKLNN